MKDFVYILGSGSKYNDLEIKYSLMSVQRFVRNVRRIYVVGDIPRRPVDVDFAHLRADDLSDNKSANARNKLLKFAKHETALNDFVLMNDDFFFCREVDADAIKPTASGTLQMHIESREGQASNYYKALVNTDAALKALKYPTRDFETHVPMPMERDKFVHLVKNVDWSKRPCPLFRSMYGNMFGIAAERLMDLKIQEPLPEDEIRRRIGNRAFFSIGDGALAPRGDMVKFLHHITTSKQYDPKEMRGV